MNWIDATRDVALSQRRVFTHLIGWWYLLKNITHDLSRAIASKHQTSTKPTKITLKYWIEGFVIAAKNKIKMSHLLRVTRLILLIVSGAIIVAVVVSEMQKVFEILRK